MTDRIDALAVHVSAGWKASLIVDLAIISLLVDAKVIPPDALIARIEDLYNKLEAAQHPEVLVRIDAILEEIRNQPGVTG